MASDSLFGQANDEFINENYEKAVQLYDEALKIDTSRDDIYCNRAQAYIKLERYKEAVEDAIEAISINPKNKKAHLRKGNSLFHLEDYQAAKEAFLEGQVADAEDHTFVTWIRKCDAEIDLLQQNTAGGNVGVSQTPEEVKVDKSPVTPVSMDSSSKPQPQPVVAMPIKEKSRYDWYQTQTHVIVTILLKNVREEDMNINIQEKSLSATIKLPGGSDYCLELDLSYPIRPEQSQAKLMKSKIEVKLKKQEGIQWKKLEGEEQTSMKQIQLKDESIAMSYPTSSHYTRNWDKLAHDVAEEEKNEKKEGDAALNDLFQKIYADGSDEQKKAMVKSFSESGGTVLSTDWNNIGKEKTEVKPPDGMEYKKY